MLDRWKRGVKGQECDARTERVVGHVSAEEKAKIAAAAEREALSMSAYIRRRLIYEGE